MKPKMIIPIVTFFVFSIATPSWSAETTPEIATATETVVVQGESPVYDNKIIPARKDALEDAFRNAVRKVLGTLVTAESYTQNAVSIDDSIVTRAKGYVKTYDILEEQRNHDSIIVKVKVTISVMPVKNDLDALRILIESMGNPRIVVIINEEGQEAMIGSFASQQIIKTFSMNGFSVVDPFSTGILKEKEVLNAFKDGDFSGFCRDEPQADILMIGKGGVENVTNLDIDGLVGCIVHLDIKVVSAKTGKILAEKCLDANGVGANKTSACKNAFSKAGENICEPLTDEITKIWGNSLLNGRDILLEVSVEDYLKLRNFQRRIGYLFGVKQVNQQYYKNGKAVFLLKFTGSSQTLADIISTTYFMDVKVEIIELSSDRVKVAVK